MICPIHRDCSSPRKRPRFLVTDTNSAELIKHASNSFLAMKISFINMVADLCEAAGADINKVVRRNGARSPHWQLVSSTRNRFRRVLFSQRCSGLHPDRREVRLRFLVAQGSGENQSAADRILIVEKIRKELWSIRVARRSAFGGLAFKPNTDDLRFATSIPLIQTLLGRRRHHQRL